MYKFTTFTPPKLTAEQERSLAQRIQVVGRDEFIFALRKHSGRPSASGSISDFLSDIIADAENNKRADRRVRTTREIKIYSIVISVLFVVCAIIGLFYTRNNILRLGCLYIALGLPVFMIYLFSALRGMETWVTNLLLERSEHHGKPPQGSPQWVEDSKALAPDPNGGTDPDVLTHVHEVACDWLEQFSRDAAHPLAPSQLRADWETIKNWLGGSATGENAATAEELSISAYQYEYFARGFEQYMREGNAPTQELSDMFAQYKEWLTEIYPKKSDRNGNLTPEVRAVFGRMMAGRWPDPSWTELRAFSSP